MGLLRDIFTWGNGPAPAPERAPAQQAAPAQRWSRPLNFMLDVPPEMTQGGALLDGPLERRVGRAQAMSVPAVKRARDLICGTLGALPLQTHSPTRAVVTDTYTLLQQPEIDVARSVTMTRTIEDMLFEGRAWWRVTEFGWHGYPTKIRKLDARTVNVHQDAKVYVSSVDGRSQGQAMEYVPDAELIRIDSPNDPLLLAGARAIRIALLLDRTASRYAEDPLPLGYFAPRDGAADPSPDEVRDLLDEWEDARRDRVWNYVGAALEAKALQWNPEQLQLSAARDTAVLEIARLTGLDPEDLGVSTTSRTYANAEQRRLDLIDFTLSAFASAVQDRLSMGDVLPRGYVARYEYAHFLKSDTLTRMQAYKAGREVGVYNDERIAVLENIPTATVPTPAAPTAPPAPAPQEGNPVSAAQHAPAPVARFADEQGSITMGFDAGTSAVEFTVDSATRTVSGIAVPWGSIARSGYARWKFAPNSLHWGGDTTRVKLNRDHDRYQSFGYAATLSSSDAGLGSAFKVARGPVGDEMLALAEDKVYDGFSIEIDFEDGDGWTPDPVDESVRLVHSATLRAVALTAMPAFDDARVAHVAATREDTTTMTAPAAPAPAAPVAPAAAPAVDFVQFTAGLSGAIGTAIADAFAKLPLPQHQEGRQVIPAGQGAHVVSEPLVYQMNGGSGPSMIKDAWKSRTEGDHDARERLGKFSLQLQDAQRKASGILAANFAAGNTTNAAAIVPPGYRPDLYVTQLLQGRPFWQSVSRGSLSDATPFTIPRFGTATAMAGNHTEGTNPTTGNLTVGTVTVTPGAVSGLFTITREIADSSNPAIDAIATQAMSEAYSQNAEAKLYAELNGVNGAGGTITVGQVPSGAWVYTSTGGSVAAGTYGGEKLLATERMLLAQYPFHRFAAPNHAHLSQEGTTAYATAVDGNGRSLLPSIGAQNSSGLGNALTQGWSVDGLPNVPTWSMSGNGAADADVLVFNSQDVWGWESPLLTFRFEERGGPANIDLALFGYVAVRLLRPAGLHAIRHTVGA
ncbi:phage portal protein [Amycolatopsis sp. H20-H5]|uniref:phage portal protein n=1 Tax=Amycolatopsis sp. H20-H5 TaxID=3046309 RepID=UPI002DB94AC6|nr:phage portal protein [Amycolatopsis sp. H20-H5]MEC3975093.1 phage portal protein [Amycolatopsis sp. H20-H5]